MKLGDRKYFVVRLGLFLITLVLLFWEISNKSIDNPATYIKFIGCVALSNALFRIFPKNTIEFCYKDFGRVLTTVYIAIYVSFLLLLVYYVVIESPSLDLSFSYVFMMVVFSVLTFRGLKYLKNGKFN